MDLKKIKNDYRLEFVSELNFFRDPRFGLIVGVPLGWVDNSNQDFFQVCEPDLKTYLTASMYRISGLNLAAWTTVRLGTVAQNMSYLTQIGELFQVSGANWIGNAAEYRGTFPNNDFLSRYLVLCITRGEDLISFTITARDEEFEKNDQLFRWIIDKALILESVTAAE